METYEFSGTFELGSLLIEPVHVRIEELRPVIAAHAHSNTSFEIHYIEQGQGSVTIDATVDSGQLNFKLYDNGTPFDPTTQPEVDTTLTAEQRVEGGLGIHLMRRFMDSIDYEHADGHNILTLKKNVEK